jgi:crotonobetainyl-CoA:carnitine CoA-transferase CaiB-like acyl-CoA transferase
MRRLPAAARIPTLGEHTGEVLEELGFDADARAALVASDTVPRDGKAPPLARP